jgi:hypothetical protein
MKRFSPSCGAFVEARYRFDGEEENVCAIRTGVSIAFGHSDEVPGRSLEIERLHTTTTNTIDKKTGTKTDPAVTVDRDQSKTTKTMTTYPDGTTTRSRETGNVDGSKETSTKTRDGLWTFTTTDKMAGLTRPVVMTKVGR